MPAKELLSDKNKGLKVTSKDLNKGSGRGQSPKAANYDECVRVCVRVEGLVGLTSWICCSRSSRELRVSCSFLSFSKRAMSWAAKADGSTGVISLGSLCVLYKHQQEGGGVRD